MRVAVYSGSFDPLHIGHLAVLKHLSACFDSVRLVVSPQSPFKESGKSRNASERYAAAAEAVRRHPSLKNVTVDDIELHLPAPQYTIKTLDALREREPGNSFTLVIGADNLQCIRGWRDYARILSDYGVIVFPRGGIDTSALRDDLLRESPLYKIGLADVPEVDVSSSFIRDCRDKGRDVSDLLM